MDGAVDHRHTWTVVLGGALEPEGSWPGDISSPLSQTLDLAMSISDARRVVVPLPAREPWAALPGGPSHPVLDQGRVLREPSDRGTACSLFLALCLVQAVDPEALIVVLPADHFVHPAHALGIRVTAALDTARRIDRTVVLGVAPTSLEARHGWILPGSPVARVSQLEVRRVETFIERPSHDLAALIRDTGGLWSTMMLAAPLERLWASGLRSLPELLTPLDPFPAVAGTPLERPWLDATYARLPRRSIASDFLHRLGEELAVAELNEVSWCDWESSRRILDVLHDLGGRPENIGAP